MKTPLPEKIETESGTQWVESSLPYKINQLIDRVAELTKIVEGSYQREDEEINMPGFEGTRENLDKISIN